MLPDAPMNTASIRAPLEPRRSMTGPGPGATTQLAFLLLSLSVFIAIPAFAATENLLLNGDLRAGSADMPEQWKMVPGAPSDSFEWSHGQPAPADLEIGPASRASSHNFWSQTANLGEAGWYRLRAEVKTVNSGSEAVIEIRGSQGRALVAQSSADWVPIEVYFKIVHPNEDVRVACGLRGRRGGRAFFRAFVLNRIFGGPPRGAMELDIGSKFYTLPAPDNSQFANLPDSEQAALRGVELAQPPPDQSLWSSILNFRVVAAVLIALAALILLDWRYRPAPSRADPRERFFRDPEVRKSAAVAAFLCLCWLGTWLVTRVEYLPGHGFYVVEPRAVAGDEPHYLLMINGLLLRHDFQLQTAYDDVDRGGPEAGVMARGTKLDRHTIVVNRRTGHRATGIVEGRSGGLWHRDPRAEFAPSADLYEISVHPPAFPMLIAALLAPQRPRAAAVEPDVGFVLMMIAWLGVVATYFVGRQVGMARRWAILAAAILFAASPWLPYSRAFFAESTIGAALIIGLWALISDWPILAALAAGASALMKPPFALVGAGFLLEEVREKRWKDALKIAAVMALGLPAFVVVIHNFGLYRRFSEMGQFVNTFIDPVEGLLRYAPWTIFGFAACARATFSSSAKARLARTMAVPLFLYLLAVSSVGSGVGYCYGPRYWVAFMPWLALATVEAMRRAGRYQRALCAVLVLCGVAMAIPGALRYPQLFNLPALDAWRGFH
jgi:hypothetical protein